jgi:Phage integrase, N-terminal SAM-like domain
MAIPLAKVAAKFLERSRISKSTFRSYESTLLPLLHEYGRWPIDLMSREILSGYLESLTHLACATHHRHQAVLPSLFKMRTRQPALDHASQMPLRGSISHLFRTSQVGSLLSVVNDLCLLNI